MPNDDSATDDSAAVDLQLFEQAGLIQADIDAAQIYNACGGQIPMARGDYGFHGRGEGGPFIVGGNLAWPSEGLPANVAGGLWPDASLHRLNLVIEGVRQMAGTITSQIESARVCLVASRGGGGHEIAARPGR